MILGICKAGPPLRGSLSLSRPQGVTPFHRARLPLPSLRSFIGGAQPFTKWARPGLIIVGAFLPLGPIRYLRGDGA